MNLVPQMAKIRMDKENPILAQKAQKMPLESVKMKNSKIGLRHVLSWTKRVQDPKFHASRTFDGLGKHG